MDKRNKPLDNVDPEVLHEADKEGLTLGDVANTSAKIGGWSFLVYLVTKGVMAAVRLIRG